MGKFLGILFGFSFVLLLGVVAFRVYPEEVSRFIPPRLASALGVEQAPPPVTGPADEPLAATEADDETETDLEQDLEPKPPEELENAEALVERGQNFYDSGFLTLAINDFARAVEINPDDRKIWSRLIGAQIALRDYSAAQASAQEALRTFRDDPEFLILLGETLLQKSEFSQAKKTFEKLPVGGARDFYLGTMSAYFGDYDTAKSLLTSAKSSPEFGKNAAVLLSAFEEFSLFPDGNILHLQLLLSKSFNNLHFYEMAVQSSKRILKDRDDYRDAWIILGHSYLSLERYDLAKNVLTRALDLDPTKPETSFFLGLAEKNLGEADNAITHLSMARENGYTPQHEATRALAEAFLEGQYYDAARKEYEKLIEIRGAAVDKYVQPVRISIEFLKDSKTAKKIAESAVRNHPDSEVARNLLAWALLENDDLEEAEVLLQQIIEEHPEFAPAHLNLAKVFEKQENMETALEQYKTAYELDPHSEIGALAAESYNRIVLQEE